MTAHSAADMVAALLLTEAHMRVVRYAKVTYTISYMNFPWPLPEGGASIPDLSTPLIFDGTQIGVKVDAIASIDQGYIDDGTEPGGFFIFVKTGSTTAIVTATVELVTANLDEVSLSQAGTLYGHGPSQQWHLVGAPRFPDGPNVEFAGSILTYDHLYWGKDELFTSGNDSVNFEAMSANEASWGAGWNGGDGNDRVTLANFATILSQQAQGNYLPLYFNGDGGNDTVVGGDSANEIWGGDDNDSIVGGDGDDTLRGDAGADYLDGAADNDLIEGDTRDYNGAGGRDTLRGGPGNDTLVGSHGADLLYGDDGDDLLIGDLEYGMLEGGANDTINGGAGTDTVAIADVFAAHTITYSNGNVIVSGPGGTDVLTDVEWAQFTDRRVSLTQANLFDNTDDTVDFDILTTSQLEAWNDAPSYDALGGNDSVILPNIGHAPPGYDFSQMFRGGVGSDTIEGGNADDWIDGGADDDWIIGSDGADTLMGEGGNDTFAFGSNDVGAGKTVRIDGGSETTEDVLILDAAPTGYTVQVTQGSNWADTRTTLTATNGTNVTFDISEVERVRFLKPIEDGNETLAGETLAGEAAVRMVDIYTSPATGNWRPLSAMELGLRTSGVLDGGSYTMLGGRYTHEGGLGNADSQVSITTGVVDGERTMMITFKGSDFRVDEIGDWIADLSGVGDFYDKHQTLVARLIEYINDPHNGIEKVVVSGHSLGGAMSQLLLQDLRDNTHDVDLQGYTFGSIGAADASNAAPDLINFLHPGDIANFINLSDTRRGSFVYLQSEGSMLDRSLVADAVNAIIGGGAVGDLVLTAAANAAGQHFKEPYRSDVQALLKEAGDSESLFYSTELAAALRDGSHWSGQSASVFAGGSKANVYEIATGDDYVLGQGGDDTLTIDGASLSMNLLIDGGDGTNDTLVITDSFKDFDVGPNDNGVRDLRMKSGSGWTTIAQLKHVEKVITGNSFEKLIGATVTYTLGQGNGAPRLAAGTIAAASSVPSYTLKTGYDYITAGDGAMNIKGTSSADILYVGRGDKTIAMGDGNDIVIVKVAAGSGALKEKITIDGGKGADIMQGGRGAETFIVDDARDIVHDDGGRDTVKASIDYRLADGLETLILTGRAKNGYGNAGANTLTGTGKANALDGLGGNDTVSGGNGKDTLGGGTGKDSLTGGGKADTFMFNAKLGAKNVDTITDFKHNTDIIALDDTIFGKIGASLTSDEFYAAAGATKAHDRSDRIIYDTKSGKLFYDDDGSKKHGHDAIHFATLSNKAMLDFEDFVIA